MANTLVTEITSGGAPKVCRMRVLCAMRRQGCCRLQPSISDRAIWPPRLLCLMRHLISYRMMYGLQLLTCAMPYVSFVLLSLFCPYPVQPIISLDSCLHPVEQPIKRLSRVAGTFHPMKTPLLRFLFTFWLSNQRRHCRKPALCLHHLD